MRKIAQSGKLFANRDFFIFQLKAFFEFCIGQLFLNPAFLFFDHFILSLPSNSCFKASALSISPFGVLGPFFSKPWVKITRWPTKKKHKILPWPALNSKI